MTLLQPTTIPALMLLLFLSNPSNEAKDRNRYISYHEVQYLTTYDVPEKFYGRYTGAKSGYLLLNKDGTGTYAYDIFGFAPPTCKKIPISFEWGFIITKKGGLQKRKRSYGFSYPILLKSNGTTSFQGCHTPVLMDFILDKGMSLHVSSSDDWMKLKSSSE